ncbi:MAG: hypothetical protein NXI23_21630 [Bacteroidetes bacterium]|nr:hypothetical protein [Bacteroidota bacterium]
MNLPKADILCLKLTDQRIISWTESETLKVLPKLKKPLTSSSYKIYVLSSISGDAIVYIGTTKLSLKSRLNSGLRANGKNGYHGYKWKNQSELNIHIWTFPNLGKEEIENIEAELAFIVRLKTGKWPMHQNEIHFNNSYKDIGQKLAAEMYEIITQGNMA